MNGSINKYSDYASSHNYIVSVVTLPHITAEIAASRSSHSVSQHYVKQMMDIWEPFEQNHLKQKSFDIVDKKAIGAKEELKKKEVQKPKDTIAEEDEDS